MRTALLRVLFQIAERRRSYDGKDPSVEMPEMRRRAFGGVTFGYDGIGKETKKVKWVGQDGRWVAGKPARDFELGNWSVQVERTYYPIW